MSRRKINDRGPRWKGRRLLPLVSSHIIEEAFICGRTKAKVAPIMFLCCFSEDMSRRMPEDLLACERCESTGVSRSRWHHPPSGCSKSSSSSEHDFSSGRSKSQSTPSTLAMTILSERDLEIRVAISIGDVCQLIPVRCAPSGIVIAISWQG